VCGRFTLTASARDVARHFELAEIPALEARYNIAPAQPVPAVRAGRDGGRRLDLLTWGLVPHWARDPAIGYRTINARAETAARKPAFREALRRRRCLVAADGFYEWTGPRGARRPTWFRRPDGGVFAIAGLWERWRPQADAEASQERVTCTLLTTEANAAVRPFHDRMPVLLDPRDYDRWLDPDARDAAEVSALLVPAPPDALEARPVSSRVNDARREGPACVEPPEQTAPPQAPQASQEPDAPDE